MHREHGISKKIPKPGNASPEKPGKDGGSQDSSSVECLFMPRMQPAQAKDKPIRHWSAAKAPRGTAAATTAKKRGNEKKEKKNIREREKERERQLRRFNQTQLTA